MSNVVNENVIEWVKGDKLACVTAANGTKLKGRLMKLAQRGDIEIEIENADGSICTHIPAGWVKINPPRKMTDEQREAAIARMEILRQKKNN